MKYSRTYAAPHVALAAGLLCLLVYLRALSCDFVNFDDPDYILNSIAVSNLDLNSLGVMLTQPYVGLWMPLTWLSFAIDYHLWGQNPLGYHLTNIVLHSCNTGLVVLVADRLMPTRFVSEKHPVYLPALMLLFSGLIWGLHPLRVESVAWVSERKDVLNGLFTLGTILCYLRYVYKKDMVNGNGTAVREYIFCLILFLCSLMAKPISVVLPLVLLVIDWCPLLRLKKGTVLTILMEKTPFLIMSALISATTIYWGARSNYLQPLDFLSPFSRLLVSGNAVFEYCRLQLFPVGILPLYPIPNPLPIYFTFKTATVILFTCGCLLLGKKVRWVPATWLCFIIPLMPVLAFLQNGVQAYASRYTYLPSIAPSIVLAASLVELYRKGIEFKQGYVKAVCAALIAVMLIFCIDMTQRIIGVWKNTETFWTRVIKLQPRGSAYQKRGKFYLNSNNFKAANEDFSAAIDIATRARLPIVGNLHAQRGMALAGLERYRDALSDFTIALKLSPRPLYYYQRGLALQALGREDEAQDDFFRAGVDPRTIDGNTLLDWYNMEQ